MSRFVRTKPSQRALARIPVEEKEPAAWDALDQHEEQEEGQHEEQEEGQDDKEEERQDGEEEKKQDGEEEKKQHDELQEVEDSPEWAGVGSGAG